MANKFDINKIKIGYSKLTGQLYIYRHGADKRVALEKREAEQDVFKAIVEHMMDGMPTGAEKEVSFDGGKTWFTVRVAPGKIKDGEETPAKIKKAEAKHVPGGIRLLLTDAEAVALYRASYVIGGPPQAEDGKLLPRGMIDAIREALHKVVKTTEYRDIKTPEGSLYFDRMPPDPNKGARKVAKLMKRGKRLQEE